MALHAHECERLDFNDILRTVRADARRALGTPWPNKTDRAEYIAGLLTHDPGPHGGGFAWAPASTRLGGRRWLFACPTCRRRVQYLFRPVGWERFGCRRCVGVVQTRRDRGWRWGATLWLLVHELEAFKGQPGRRPRRYYRAARQLGGLVAAAEPILREGGAWLVARDVLLGGGQRDARAPRLPRKRSE